MSIAPNIAAASWAPRSVADWAPLVISGAVIAGLLLALAIGDSAFTAPPASVPVAREAPMDPGEARTLRAAPPRVQSGNQGSIRLVGTRALPKQNSRLTSASGCSREQLGTPSSSAAAAIQAGWHVGADFHQSGYQVVLVDAGVERQGERCVPIGASVLVFIESGLVAIAYDRSGQPASRLAAIEVTEPDGVKMMGGKGTLAHLALGDQLLLR